MALFKALFVFAFAATVSSSPLFGPMEHYLFGIPLPHTNNPIAHNLESMLTKGAEAITGIHSRGNDKPMDMSGNSGMSGMNMGGSSGMAGMDMGGSATMPGMAGMNMGGSTDNGLTASQNSDVNQKQLLQQVQILQAQAQKQKATSSNPSSDDILKYLIENSKPTVTDKTVVVDGSDDNADLKEKLAELLAAQGNQ